MKPEATKSHHLFIPHVGECSGVSKKGFDNANVTRDGSIVQG